MVVCFDLDNVLCDGHITANGSTNYSRCQPKLGAAAILKGYIKHGHTVIIQTDRRAIPENVRITKEQLANWQFEYDQLIFKPKVDLHISTVDTISAREFWNNRLERPEWQ